jgi:hypothetical protein
VGIPDGTSRIAGAGFRRRFQVGSLAERVERS